MVFACRLLTSFVVVACPALLLGQSHNHGRSAQLSDDGYAVDYFDDGPGSHAHGVAVPASHQTGANPGDWPARGWFTQWEHRHHNVRGAPQVHHFGIEPAYLDRDLLIDYAQTRGDEGSEREFELELEWAFTSRLGLIVEAPLVRVHPNGESVETGIGDLAIAPRALILDTERLLLSANFEVGIPTGDEDRGLGSGEAVLAPSLSLWADCAAFPESQQWVTFQAQVGTEHGAESGDSELSYACGLAWTMAPDGAIFHGSGAHGPHRGLEPDVHGVAGSLNLLTEFSGRTGLSGEADSMSSFELLFGASVALSGRWEVRGGYQFPVGGRSEFDDSFLLGVVFHF